ncbi:peptidoglycan D,D-transpeptidase FtsI family protein [Thioalkalivibrio paradoxus]|uniref:Peptidoglycan D,D-transpeptidase FtsI n=1 Tax=Thioalkalivibrio paradoxus ARh 1 TaxID=713585 RepID=W0DLG5_9GAMM|nr:penicillin-binding protein 2 [Thioalkalivibrio paradoxus]AHE99281.1 cell division protein [Thioalkalivibrio paradoxus ARh 1]
MGALKRQVSHLRLKVVAAGLLVVVAVLLLRALDLQVLSRDFLQSEGEARQVRTVVEPAHRGLITDRHGEPLAISGPVKTAWAHPGELWAEAERLPELARVLQLDPAALRARVESRADREFIYLRRHLPPEQAQQVAALQIPGVALMREFRRYYPHGETTAHIVGFTNIDEQGQEGMELAFDGWLSGQPGAKRVLRDRHGRSIRDVASIRPARDGENLRLTIDQRLQYLAYRELKAAVQAHDARGGSAVLVDARSGDILALVNQPGFNPNNRAQMDLSLTRNRAATDSLEPGSVIKPFTVAAALETGTVDPDVVLDTTPGTMRVGRHTVRDIRNFGRIDLATLISRSSNVGSTQLALEMPPGDFWRMLHQAGFGRSLGTGLPGEVTGLLRDYPTWRRVEVATLGYGYGLSVTPLHLAAAYTAFANDGHRVPLRLVETAGDLRHPEPVMRADTARAVLAMMERVTGSEGTARQAAISGYRVAGKTGTSRKAVAGGYSADTYVSAFVGLAPVSDPRFVMAVVVDEPSAGVYYGGAVAAPVFARVVEAALRLFHVPPDNLSEPPLRMARERGGPRS